MTDLNTFLTFKVDDEIYAINVVKILRLLELVKITKVPEAPGYMKGVINLQGIVLPIIDIRIKFHLPEIELTENSIIIVTQISINNNVTDIGILVDAVEEVIAINEGQILAPPSIGSQYRSEFIIGMAEVSNNFIFIIDIDKVFSSFEINQIKETEQVELIN